MRRLAELMVLLCAMGLLLHRGHSLCVRRHSRDNVPHQNVCVCVCASAFRRPSVSPRVVCEFEKENSISPMTATLGYACTFSIIELFDNLPCYLSLVARAETYALKSTLQLIFFLRSFASTQTCCLERAPCARSCIGSHRARRTFSGAPRIAPQNCMLSKIHQQHTVHIFRDIYSECMFMFVCRTECANVLVLLFR